MPQPSRLPPDPAEGARARVIALRPEVSGEGDAAGAGPGAEPEAVLGGWVPETRRFRRGSSRRFTRREGVRGRARDAAGAGIGAHHEPGPAGIEGVRAGPGGRAGADTPCPADPDAGPDGDVDPDTGPAMPPDGDVSDGGQASWSARLVRAGPWGELAERWVPQPLREARVSPGRRGAVVLSVIAAVAAVAAAVGVWWGRPSPAPVALPPVTTGTDQPGHAATGTGPGPAPTEQQHAPKASPLAVTSTVSPAPAGPILVSVTGEVRHPGVVTVPAGARVADAIAAAGGALDPSDLTGLNLAAPLSDGDSVVVAGPGGSVLDAASSQPTGRVPPTGAGTAPIDLNTADQAALEELPGVGPVTAAAILAWRTEHGPFSSVEQIQAIPGIGPATYAQIAPHVTI